jgi:hypothetical protein
MYHVWRGGRVNTELWCGNLRERDNLEDPGVDGRIMLKRISKKWDGGMDWIDLAQDRDRWQALVNAVMNLRASLNARNILTVWGPVSFSRKILLHGVNFAYV